MSQRITPASPHGQEPEQVISGAKPHKRLRESAFPAPAVEPVADVSREDLAAYRVYLRLPQPVRAAVRTFVFLCANDQNIVRKLIEALTRPSTDPDGGLPVPDTSMGLRLVAGTKPDFKDRAA